MFQEIRRRGVRDLEVRLVGQTPSIGAEFAALYPFVRYWALSERSLRIEAATWAVFLNPLFGLARGASMKLAAGLALGLPVISTRIGARGYDFGGAHFPTTDNSPVSFVDAVLHLISTPDALGAAAETSRRVTASAPTVAEIGRRLCEFGRGLQ